MLSPGTYEHMVVKNRKLKYLGSFGGPQTLVLPVRTRNHEGTNVKLRVFMTNYYTICYAAITIVMVSLALE